MAEKRAQQESFDWATQRSETADPAQTLASPSKPTPISTNPRRARRVQPSVALSDGRWLTADEATLYLGLPTRNALYAAVERGQVPAHRFGRRLRF